MISLLYTGNAGVFDGILISLLSAAQHTKEELDVYLLTMDLRDRGERYLPIDEGMRAYLEETVRRENAGSRVTLIDAGDLYRAELIDSPNAETGYTPYALLRLFADRLPGLPSKILYLDADTVIAGDLRPLFETDVNGCEYAAALDYYGKIFMGWRYINSGVMLLNLEQIRKTGLFSRAVELLAKKKLFLPDQTAIYRLTKKKYILPRRYNEQKNYQKENTVIQHFTKTIVWLPYFHTKNIKPWQTDLVKSELTHRYDPLLDEYLLRREQFLQSREER